MKFGASLPAHTLGTQFCGEFNFKNYCSHTISTGACSEGIFYTPQTISSCTKCTWNLVRICQHTQWVLNSRLNSTLNSIVVSLYKLGDAPRAYSICPRLFSVALNVHEIWCEFALNTQFWAESTFKYYCSWIRILITICYTNILPGVLMLCGRIQAC